MATLIITHLLVGVLGYLMGWAMNNRRRKNDDMQMETNFRENLAELKKQLTRSSFISL